MELAEAIEAFAAELHAAVDVAPVVRGGNPLLLHGQVLQNARPDAGRG